MKQHSIYQKLYVIFTRLANWCLQNHGVESAVTKDVTISFDDTTLHLGFADDGTPRIFHYDLDGELFTLTAGPLRNYMEASDYYGYARDGQSAELVDRLPLAVSSVVDSSTDV